MTTTTTKTGSYAIISLGGKQYVVREGERLLVDRVGTEEGKTFHPGVLFLGGDGKGELAPKSQVTARVVGHVLGEKVRIGKHRPKTGYRRHTGFRARLSQIEIESIGGAKRAAAAKPAAAPKPEAAPAKEEAAPKPKPAVAAPTPDQAEAPAPVAEETAAHPPKDYPDYTVADIAEKAKHWRLEQVEAALEYERAHANRKGAIAALESTIDAKKGS